MNNQSNKFLSITKKHITKKSPNSKLKEKRKILHKQKTHLATGGGGGPNKFREVQKKSKKLIINNLTVFRCFQWVEKGYTGNK